MNHLTDRQQPPLTPRKLGLMIALAVVVTLLLTGAIGGSVAGSILWLVQLLADLGQLAIIVMAAGGLAYPLVRKLAPAEAPAGLKVLSAVGLGLWLLGTLVLAAGTLVHGALSAWVWWSLTAAGVVATLWQCRHTITEKLVLPSRLESRSLIYILLAIAAGLWASGATCPPGWCQLNSDGYDVLEYHLQVPREYLANQRIAPLTHNCYSFYPMGQEMLHLLAMSLRGGAYEGMYLANLVHGMYLVLAVAAVLTTLRREDDTCGRVSAVLLGTAPLLVYLSFLAMVELSAVFYLVLALLWLRRWLAEFQWRPAVMVGLAVGGACATKYVAVGMVAIPVLVVMILAPLFVRQASSLSAMGTFGASIGHAGIAGLLGLLLLSPWLVRNTIYTGNPVFPLATSVFGQGYWSQQSQQRWQAGHGRVNLPPVPPPRGIELPPPGQTPAAHGLVDNFLLNSQFNQFMILLLLAAIAWVFAGGGGAWERSLLTMIVIQIALWAALSHNMPPRFLAVALAPMSLLVGSMLARLAAVAKNPIRRSAPADGRWGLSAVAVLVVVTAGINLVTAGNMLSDAAKHQFSSLRYKPGKDFVQEDAGFAQVLKLPPTARLLLVGQVPSFYAPPGTVYATAFDSDDSRPIPFQSTPAQTLAKLRQLGVTHILVDWIEMDRLAKTYGYPPRLVDDLYTRLGRQGRSVLLQGKGEDRIVTAEAGKIGLNWIDAMGLTVVQHVQPDFSKPASNPATSSAPASGPQPPDLSVFRPDYFHVLLKQDDPNRRALLTRLSLYSLPAERQ